MNSDKKELFETGAVIYLVTMFSVLSILCVKWGVSYQVLIVFAGFIGTLLGVLGNKLRAGTTNPTPTDSKIPNGQ